MVKDILAVLGAWFLLSALLGIAYADVRRWLRTRHEDPAETPAPPRPARGAGPGHPPHRGRLTSVTKKWDCGCAQVWTGPGKLTEFPCPAHACDFDTELRSLLDDQR